MEDKILDLSKMDDATFKVVKNATEDMMNNGTHYIIDNTKKFNSAMNVSYDFGVIAGGIGLAVGGVVLAVWDYFKIKKSSK